MAERICTIASVAWLAQARVLANSFRRSHPDGEAVVLVIDDSRAELVDDASEPFRVVRPEWLDVGEDEMLVRAGIYSATELSTSCKPWLIERLLEESAEPVLYLDSDIEVFAPLDDLFALADRRGLALTPHVLRPLPRDGRHPSGTDILAAGVYNAGFLGAGRRSLSSGFFSYWRDQLARDSLLDPERMLFFDQRWLDAIECFEHGIVHDPTVNLAYWNAWAYDLMLENDEVLVDGQPLRLFHFSGFDPREPQLLSRHQDRISLADEPALAWLCSHYVTSLRDAGIDECRRVPYGWARAGEMSLDRTARRVYREAVLNAEAQRGTPEADKSMMPPSPFGTRPRNAFVSWLGQPAVPEGCPRYLRGYRDNRADLRFGFPDIDGVDAHRFVEVAALDGGLRAELAAQCVPRIARGDHANARPLWGLNIAGCFGEVDPLGEASRLLARSAAAVGLPFATTAAPAEDDAPVTRYPEGEMGWPFDVSVLCVGERVTLDNWRELHPDAFDSRHTVALWDGAGPAPTSPPDSQWVDAVWVPSRFAQASLRGGTVPVHVFPWPIPVRSEAPRLTRQDLGLEAGFVIVSFLEGHDLQRQNPGGLVAAYEGAFDPAEGTQLVLAVIGSNPDAELLDGLMPSSNRPDVVVRTYAPEPIELQGLIAQADCYASLHRAEGFGLRLAQAVALATPTVATAWSGNLDFMDGETTRLVCAEPASAADGASWCEPDLTSAADQLRWVFEHRSEAAALAARARAHVAATRTLDAAGRFVTSTCDQLRLEARTR